MLIFAETTEVDHELLGPQVRSGLASSVCHFIIPSNQASAMKKTLLFASLALCFALGQLQAQPSRYLDEVFEEVELSTDVVYGTNITILLIYQGFPPVPQPLRADVYEPAGDTAAQRPLAILTHAGNFLPKTLFSGRLGSKDDSCLVYLAHQLAQRGYVVAVMGNRLGWNPVDADTTIRRFELANAMYRGIQDVHTCVRFFKKHAAEYRVHPEKIMVWGDGSGGELALSAAALDSYEAWRRPPFTMNIPPFEMVQDSVNGDIFATSAGVVPPGYPFFTAGDTLCLPNHLGYDSDFQLAVSMGGNIIDTAWIQPGAPPMIAFQALPNQVAAYDDCEFPPILVPLPPVHVYWHWLLFSTCGSLVTIRDVVSKGNNAVFAGLQHPGDFSEVANSRNDGFDGLFPLTSVPNASSNSHNTAPWRWWSEAAGPDSPPAELAKSYLDTMLAYVAPRACMALGLDCANLTSAPTLPAPASAPPIAFAPNPASGLTEARLPIATDRRGRLWLIDANGRRLRALETVGEQATLDLHGLPAGVYFVRWSVGEQVFQGRVVLR